MSARPPLELERPRDLGELLGTSLHIYRENFGTLIAIAAAVAIPVNVIVLGLGLEQLFSDYDDSPSSGEGIVLFLTPLLTTLLITAMAAAALLELGQGRKPSAGPSIQRGLDVFPPLLLAELLAIAGIFLGFLLLILPGIYLLIRWYFVVQAVVIENARGTGALERSAQLVSGSWWRVLGIVVVVVLIGAVASTAITLPAGIAADAADHSGPALAGGIVVDTLLAPFGALVSTLLYFDLRARIRRERIPEEVSGPPDPPGLPPSS